MIWALFIISGVFVLLIINGMIHQERYIIWKRKQAELVQVKKLDMDNRKKAAADRIKDMLRETRRRATEDGEADGAPAQGDAQAAPQTRTASAN